MAYCSILLVLHIIHGITKAMFFINNQENSGNWTLAQAKSCVGLHSHIQTPVISSSWIRSPAAVMALEKTMNHAMMETWRTMMRARAPAGLFVEVTNNNVA